jgi:hypothetical protein
MCNEPDNFLNPDDDRKQITAFALSIDVKPIGETLFRVAAGMIHNDPGGFCRLADELSCASVARLRYDLAAR